MAELELSGLSRSFGSAKAVDDLSLTVADGELVCFLGPSGSGKSTVLRMVGGFERPDQGRVLINGRDVTGLPPERRPTGMVFQSHALWSHMNVFQNVAFGLRVRRLPKAEIAAKVTEVLSLVGLADFGSRRVWQLSGGQQQRVAIARALVLEPQILLLDEPFASLDQHLRERLREELREIQRRLGITTLFVTHGQDEALALADRIVVLRDGRIEQVDAPDVAYRRPKTLFAAGFIGQMNVLSTDFINGQSSRADLKIAAAIPDGPAVLAFRPEATMVHSAAEGASAQAHICRATDFGSHLMLELELAGGTRIKAQRPPGPCPANGSAVTLEVQSCAIYRDDQLIHMTGEQDDI